MQSPVSKHLLPFSASVLVTISGCSSFTNTVGTSTSMGEPVPPGCSKVSKTLEESWDLAVQRAKGAYTKHSKHITKKDRVAVINYVIPNDREDRLRLYDPSEEWKLVESHWVSHAFNSDVAYEPGLEELYTDGCATQFSNVSQSLTSSKGAMITANAKAPSEWGREKLQVHGKDKKLNGNVFARTIVFHQALDKQGEPATFSHGCFMLKPEDLDQVFDQIVGGALVYVHHE